MTGTKAANLVEALEHRAKKLGFDAFGIAPVDLGGRAAERLTVALGAGWHGDMAWMAETAERRGAPRNLWPEARSVIMLGLSYAPASDPLANLEQGELGTVSAYARNRDYHDIVKGRLKEIAGLLARKAGARVKVFVDTAPVMEKPLAEAAGLGWQGKHTVLVSRQHGSWLFLGTIFTDAELPASEPHAERCGKCTRCLDICPTKAFPAPFQLDARRCIAYLTVEHKGQIPRAFRAPMGNRIFGCDDCLAVCPWNKFAQQTREIGLKARPELDAPRLDEMAGFSDAEFRALFSRSPVKRLGHTRFLRNVLIAMGNSGQPEMLRKISVHLGSEAPLVRGAAIWAFRRLATPAEIAHMQQLHLRRERDAEVAAEWRGELTPAY